MCSYSDDAAAADLEANNEPIDVPRWFAYKDSVESLFSSVDKDSTLLQLLVWSYGAASHALGCE